MSLKTDISTQMKEAMKAREQIKLSTLRMVLAAIKNREIEIRGEVDDAECIRVLSKLAKQRGESIELYKKADRMELVEKETAELAVIESFLPKQMSDDELAKLVDEAVSEAGAQGPKDMGKVMKIISPKAAGRADGRKVSEAVKQHLAKL